MMITALKINPSRGLHSIVNSQGLSPSSNLAKLKEIQDFKFSGTNILKFKKGEFIYSKGDHASELFILKKGRVKIGSHGNSKRLLTKYIVDDGEIFGETSLFGQKIRKDFALAMENVVVEKVSASKMINQIKSDFDLYTEIMRMIGTRLMETERRLASYVFNDSRTRIIEFIIYLNMNKGARVGFEHVIRKFITHQDIARLTDTSRQTVTVVLNELRSANIITFNRKRLLIRDLEALKGLINFDKTRH